MYFVKTKISFRAMNEKKRLVLCWNDDTNNRIEVQLL